MGAMVYVLLLAIVFSVSAQNNLNIKLDNDDGYTIMMGDKEWLKSGPTTVMNNGVELTNNNARLQLMKQDSYPSRSQFGTFVSHLYHYEDSKSDFKFNTYINVYDNEPIIIFGQQFITAATNTSKGNTDGTISSFPSFLVKELDNTLGFLTFYSSQIADTQIGKWTSDIEIHHGADGGFPLVLFDSVMQNTIVISPYNTFMSAGTDFVTSKDSKTDSYLGFGILSSVEGVPIGYEYETILVGGNNVTGTMLRFGQILQERYRNDVSYRESDYTLNYLGYWTDNGACYYHYTGEYSNYEEVVLAINNQAKKLNIPFQYVQLDDWWYYWDKNGACMNWTAKPDIFPNGIENIARQTKWPIHAHNKYWSINNVYAKQNGGKYNFIIDKDTEVALPLDDNFWRDFLQNKKQKWGLKVYEQDFLVTTFFKQSQLQTELNLGRTWLLQMGEAALDLDIRIQYCMSLTRHVLQSVEIPAVTQVRVSRDYQPGNGQWAISDSSILAHSVGLAPSKDNFHSTVVEKGKCRFTEPAVDKELEVFSAALSGGIIGPSDTANGLNRTMIITTCMSDGRVLKPSRPAMSLDSTFLQRAFGKGGPKGRVHVTYSVVGDYTWYLLITANMSEDYSLYPTELPTTVNTDPKSDDFVMYASRNSIGFTSLYNLTKITPSSPVPVKKCTQAIFQLWLLAPVLGNSDHSTNTVLLGELDKVIKVSVTRFTDIQSIDGFIHVISMRGAPQEIVHISFLNTVNSLVYTVNCAINSDGTAQIIGDVYNSYRCH